MRFGRSEDALLAALGSVREEDPRVAEVVKRLRPERLRRILALTPGERLDRAFALMAFAKDLGTARELRER